MSSRTQVYLFALLFILFGAGLTAYKSQTLGLPLTPGQLDTVWVIEARVTFTPLPDSSIQATLALPNVDESYALLSESFSSSGFGFDTEILPSGQRRVVWTKRHGKGQQQLYYRLHIAEVSGNPTQHIPPPAEVPDSPEWMNAERDVALSLIARAPELSADTESLTRQILLQLNSKQNNDAEFLLQAFPDASKAGLALRLLAETGVHARRIRGLTLESDHLLPDDHHRLDYRTDVDLVGGRRGQGGIYPGWRQPVGGGGDLPVHEQRLCDPSDLQLSRNPVYRGRTYLVDGPVQWIP
ncbi:MAG: UUP1 family membrane protein, partial [Motiliproteus sp.]